jgi:hypothetical protein
MKKYKKTLCIVLAVVSLIIIISAVSFLIFRDSIFESAMSELQSKMEKF